MGCSHRQHGAARVAPSTLPLKSSLSRSNKKVLHLDPNPYYGGSEAAFSLDEAEEWAKKHAGNEELFGNASIARLDPSVGTGSSVSLASSRAYALALAPQLIQARSNLIPALVSSQTHSQLEFQAVGSWFILGTADDPSVPTLTKVPSGREDVFSDTSMGPRAKRSLMKFLRFVGTFDDRPEEWQDQADTPFSDVLEQRFGLPVDTQGPLLALALTTTPAQQTTFGQALPAIARHLRSIGIFGPGFGAVIPKWGGLAEISQVACRACAVGGGVYVLNRSWTLSETSEDDLCHLMLQNGEKIRSKYLVTTGPPNAKSVSTGPRIAHSISIISSTLPSLFPPTSEGGVTPAGAVVTEPSDDPRKPPVYTMAHSSEAGECPSTQCVLYSSVQLNEDESPATGFERLSNAVSSLLQASTRDASAPSVLWRMQYVRLQSQAQKSESMPQTKILSLPPLSSDLAVSDDVLEQVKAAWKAILGGEEDGSAFLQFEPRDGFTEQDSLNEDI